MVQLCNINYFEEWRTVRFINPAKVCKGMEMGDIPPSRG